MPSAVPHPSYRLFEARVVRTVRVSPAFVRVTLTGPTLDLFAPWGLDQRIKLVLPLEGTGYDTFPTDDWWPSWRALPVHEQNAFRTYTARAVRPQLREVDVDILTLGQYLRPSANHHPLDRYYTPDEFAQLREAGREMGYRHVESGPLVRSSYHAWEQVQAAGV